MVHESLWRMFACTIIPSIQPIHSSRSAKTYQTTQYTNTRSHCEYYNTYASIHKHIWKYYVQSLHTNASIAVSVSVMKKCGLGNYAISSHNTHIAHSHVPLTILVGAVPRKPLHHLKCLSVWFSIIYLHSDASVYTCVCVWQRVYISKFTVTLAVLLRCRASQL